MLYIITKQILLNFVPYSRSVVQIVFSQISKVRISEIKTAISANTPNSKSDVEQRKRLETFIGYGNKEVLTKASATLVSKFSPYYHRILLLTTMKGRL